MFTIFKSDSKETEKHPDLRWIFGSKSKVIEIFGYSVSLTTFIFASDLEWTFNQPSKEKYPPSLARDFNLFAQIGLFCEQIFEMSFDEVKPIFEETKNNFYPALFEIVTPEIKNELKSQLIYYMSNYSSYLKEIQSKRLILTERLGDNVLYRNVIT